VGPDGKSMPFGSKEFQPILEEYWIGGNFKPILKKCISLKRYYDIVLNRRSTDSTKKKLSIDLTEMNT
jgi:hypothetical protein